MYGSFARRSQSSKRLSIDYPFRARSKNVWCINIQVLYKLRIICIHVSKSKSKEELSARDRGISSKAVNVLFEDLEDLFDCTGALWRWLEAEVLADSTNRTKNKEEGVGAVSVMVQLKVIEKGSGRMNKGKAAKKIELDNECDIGYEEPKELEVKD